MATVQVVWKGVSETITEMMDSGELAILVRRSLDRAIINQIEYGPPPRIELIPIPFARATLIRPNYPHISQRKPNRKRNRNG